LSPPPAARHTRTPSTPACPHRHPARRSGGAPAGRRRGRPATLPLDHFPFGPRGVRPIGPAATGPLQVEVRVALVASRLYEAERIPTLRARRQVILLRRQSIRAGALGARLGRGQGLSSWTALGRRKCQHRFEPGQTSRTRCSSVSHFDVREITAILAEPEADEPVRPTLDTQLPTRGRDSTTQEDLAPAQAPDSPSLL